ncbi:MAG: response regulator [bacterium]
MAERPEHKYHRLAHKFIFYNLVAFIPLLIVGGVLLFSKGSKKEIHIETLNKNEREKIAVAANNINEKIIIQLNNHLENIAIISSHNQLQSLLYQVRLSGRLNKKKQCIELKEPSLYYTPLYTYFKEVAQHSSQIKSIDLYWRNGYLLCGVEDKGGERYVGDRKWFQETMEPNFKSLKAFYISTRSEIHYATPIDIMGKRLAVLLIRMDAHSISNCIFKNTSQDNNIYAALVDTTSEEGDPLVVFSSCSTPANVIKDLVNALKQHLSEQENVPFHFYHNGDKWWAHYRQMPLDQKQWYVVTTRASTELKQGQYFMSSSWAKGIIICCLCVTMCVSIIGMWNFYLTIFNPLSWLEEKMCRVIESGMESDLYDYDLNIECPQELSSLMHNFKIMMKKIKNEFNTMQDLPKSRGGVKTENNIFKAIFEAAADGIRVLDNELNVLLANPKMASLIGIPVEEQVGKKCFENSLFTDCQGKKCKFKGILESGITTLRKEFKYNGTKDEVWLQLNATGLKDNKKNVIGIIQFFKDITEEMRVKSDNTEKERELFFIKKAHKYSKNTKNQLCAFLSDELSFPVISIFKIARLMGERIMDEEQHKYIDQIKLSAFSFFEVINNIIDYKNIKLNTLKIEKMRFNLVTLLEEVFHQFTEELEEKKLELSCDISPEIPNLLLGDPERVRQVLQSVIKHVIKLSEKGTLIIGIKIASNGYKKDDLCPLQFSLTYRGDSRHSYNRYKMFSAFSHENESDLTISLIKALIKLMDGRIWIENKENKEKVLYFSSLVRVPPALPQENSKKVKTVKDLKGMRALIFNPITKMRKKLSKELASYNITIHEAHNEKEMMEKLESAERAQLPYHFLMVDNSSMPEKNIFEMAKHIKNNPALSDLSIILLPFYSLPGDFARCKESSVRAYLSPPVSESDMLSTLVTIQEGGDNQELITKYSISGEQSKKHVLLVEDNLINQKEIRTQLAMEGCRVSCAENGKKALILLEANEYDLVLMDIQMPVLNGYETTKKIRERESHMDNNSHLPIIAMTARPIKEFREMCLESGIDDYITKPVKEDQLRDILTRWNISKIAPFIWDARKALSQAEDDVEMLYQLVHMFIEEFPDLVAKIRSSIENKDNQEIEDLVQYIIGSAGNLSAYTLIERVSEIEKLCKENNFDETSRIVDNLMIEFEQFKNQAKGLLCDMPSF